MQMELPLTLVASLERRLVTATSIARSPFTGGAQVQDWGGEWWDYSFEMALSRGRDGRVLSAFLAALGGARGTFVFKDPSARNPGLAAETPVVAGGAQTGTALATAGWTPLTTPLRAGDFFQLGASMDIGMDIGMGIGMGPRLYQLTADAQADGAGMATLAFVPRLRAAPPDGAALMVTEPAVLLRLEGPAATRIGRADSYRFSIHAREAT